MALQPTAVGMRYRILDAISRLAGGAEPRGSDSALCGAFALLGFADVTGQVEEVSSDPETVLCDLLADLMHWCDDQGGGKMVEAVNFESALERARRHYDDECLE